MLHPGVPSAETDLLPACRLLLFIGDHRFETVEDDFDAHEEHGNAIELAGAANLTL